MIWFLDLAELRDVALRNPKELERMAGKVVTKTDAARWLQMAAEKLIGEEPVSYDMVEILVSGALVSMVGALQNEAQGKKGRTHGRPRRNRDLLDDVLWQLRMDLLSQEQPQLGPYELARKVTGRSRTDPLVTRLARAESKRRRKVRDFKVADKARKPA